MARRNKKTWQAPIYVTLFVGAIYLIIFWLLAMPIAFFTISYPDETKEAHGQKVVRKVEKYLSWYMKIKDDYDKHFPLFK